MKLGRHVRAVPQASPLRSSSSNPSRTRRFRVHSFEDGVSLVDVLGGILKPEVAALISSFIAVGSVGLNMYGRILAESKRAELQKDLEMERQLYVEQYELQSVMARYRGPLLEATVDLEQRITHLITKTEECCLSQGINEEEIDYTMYTLAQFLGFLEVLRREAPRERSYLGSGNPQGTDTLATLMEGIRFVLCAYPATLNQWAAEGDSREHPGYRERRMPTPTVRPVPPPPSPASSTAPQRYPQAPSRSQPRTTSSTSSANPSRSSNGTTSSSPASSSWTSPTSPVAAIASYSSNGTAASPIGTDLVRGTPVTSSSQGAVCTSQNGNGSNGASMVSGSNNGLGWPLASVEVSTSGNAGSNGQNGAGYGGLLASMDGSTSGSGSGSAMASMDGLVDMEEMEGTCFMRISRGSQRAIGSLMIKTPVGAKRHYTISYFDFFTRLKTDPPFSAWFQGIRGDIHALLSVPRWRGQSPFPLTPWTRLLLLQQVLMDTIELLDPEFVRFPEARRLRLSAIDYSPLPNADEYKQKLMQLGRMLSQQGLATETLMSQDFGQEPLPAYLANAPKVYQRGTMSSARLRNTLESKQVMQEY